MNTFKGSRAKLMQGAFVSGHVYGQGSSVTLSFPSHYQASQMFHPEFSRERVAAEPIKPFKISLSVFPRAKTFVSAHHMAEAAWANKSCDSTNSFQTNDSSIHSTKNPNSDLCKSLKP